MYQLYNGDCLEKLKLIEDNSINLILCDLPYGTTNCKWDSIIPFDDMWEHIKRIRTDNCPILLFGQEPFSSYLRLSNIDEYKYDWIWVKNTAANFMMAKYVPLKKNELISVFTDCGVNQNCKKKSNYFPQGTVECEKHINSKSNNVTETDFLRYNKLNKEHIQTTTNYPSNILYFDKESKSVHPTQKPIALLEYLIKTYTQENDMVLDFCMGSGSTGVACMRCDRNFIGIEKEEKYFRIAEDRIREASLKLII